MKEEEENKTLYLIAGLFVLVTTVGTTYLISNPEITYFCNDTNVVGMCYKLDSSLTRCYFNESNKLQYKYCKSGWEKYNDKEVKGSEINLTTYIEVVPFELKKDFSRKVDAENYINNLKSKLNLKVNLQKVVRKPFSNEIEVYWQAVLYTQKEVIDVVCDEKEECRDIKKIVIEKINEETLTSIFPENTDKFEINKTIYKHAEEYFKNWKPNIQVEEDY